jgi:uncharacterized membrane protein
MLMKIKRKIGIFLVSVSFRIYNLGSKLISSTGIEIPTNRIVRNYRGQRKGSTTRYDRRWGR